jgi:hypothetical protein
MTDVVDADRAAVIGRDREDSHLEVIAPGPLDKPRIDALANDALVVDNPGYRTGTKRIALRLAVFVSPSRHDTLT